MPVGQAVRLGGEQGLSGGHFLLNSMALTYITQSSLFLRSRKGDIFSKLPFVDKPK